MDPALRRLLSTSPSLFVLVSACLFFLVSVSVSVSAQEKIELWPGFAPGETVREPNVEPNGDRATRVTTPFLLVYRPETVTSDVCMLILPGGGYSTCVYFNEGIPNARWWNTQGITAAVLVYRVPRPTGKPIYVSAWQDAQRAVRILRSNAPNWGLDPEKIGVQGFSAGGHLALLTALSSQTQAYEPLDELDSVPCHVNFALPVYPAYVLDDGAAGPNQRKGNDAELAPGLNFDARSCPMCLLHGDRDIYSPMGAVRIYAELRKKGIPCELHIFADAVHGFMFWNDAPNTQSWRARGLEWMKVMGYVP